MLLIKAVIIKLYCKVLLYYKDDYFETYQSSDCQRILQSITILIKWLLCNVANFGTYQSSHCQRTLQEYCNIDKMTTLQCCNFATYQSSHCQIILQSIAILQRQLLCNLSQ